MLCLRWIGALVWALCVSCVAGGLQVQSLPPPERAPGPGEVCNHDSAVEVVPPLGTDQPGEPATEKRGIRDVQVSMALMDEFLK